MDEQKRPSWLEEAKGRLSNLTDEEWLNLVCEFPAFAITASDLDSIVRLHSRAKALGIDPTQLLRAVIASHEERREAGISSTPGPARDRKREDFYFRMYPMLCFHVDLSKEASRTRGREEQRKKLLATARALEDAHFRDFRVPPRTTDTREIECDTEDVPLSQPVSLRTMGTSEIEAAVDRILKRHRHLPRGGRVGPREWSHRRIAVAAVNDIPWVKTAGGFEFKEWKAAEQTFRRHPLVSFLEGRRSPSGPDTLEILTTTAAFLKRRGRFLEKEMEKEYAAKLASAEKRVAAVENARRNRPKRR